MSRAKKRRDASKEKRAGGRKAAGSSGVDRSTKNPNSPLTSSASKSRFVQSALAKAKRERDIKVRRNHA
jgi:hypothetical protein